MKLNRGANIQPLLTSQEDILGGGTPKFTSNDKGEQYIPYALLNSKLSPEEFKSKVAEISSLRNDRGIYTIPMFGPALLGVALPPVVKLADLDPETGQTVEDPKILGLWKKNEIQDPKDIGPDAIASFVEGEIVNQDQADAYTQELYRKLKEFGYELYTRDSKIKKEIEGEKPLDTERS